MVKFKLNAIAQTRELYRDILIQCGYINKSFTSSLNKEKRLALTASIIVAGFYPNVVIVQHPTDSYSQTANGSVLLDANPSQLKFYSKEHGRVFVHPSSVNTTTGHFESSMLMYFELRSTSRPFIMYTSIVNPIALLLFGGQLKLLNNGNAVSIDGKVILQAFPRISGKCFNYNCLIVKTMI